MEGLREVCPSPAKFNSTPDDLSKAVVVEGAATFINVGKIVKVVGAQLDKGIISGKLDILKYGSNKDGFVVTTEFLYINSWKEVFSKKYDGVDGLMEWLIDYLTFAFAKDDENLKKVLESPSIMSFSSHYGHTITRRLKLLFEDARKFFFSPGSDYQYYVVEAAKTFYVVEKKNGKFFCKKIENAVKLLALLSQPSRIFRAVATDNQALSNTPLPIILKYNKPGVVQVFYEPQAESLSLFFIDENGAIYSQRVPDKDVLSTLSHFYWFIRTKLAAELFISKSEQEQERLFDVREEPLIEFYSVKKETLDYVVKQQDITAIRHARKVFDLKAVGSMLGEKTHLSFSVGNRNFSGGDQGVDYYREVASVIMQMRQKKEAYGIYITQLALDESLLKGLGAESPQTVYYLKYKKKIEDKLNAALVDKARTSGNVG
jgi:adenylate cyclase class 1